MTQDTSLSTINNKNNNGYTAEDIQVLGGREAVRRRPGMYIGSTDQRGLHHLLYEIAYNSVDEAMAGCCDRINITINKDNSVTVEDNGRGIPVEIHPTTKVSALETVMTVLHAGAKFGGKTYQVSGGLHGVGASVVNALSRWFKVQVRRDGKLYQQEYKLGVPQSKVKEVGKASGTGLTTIFLADETIFGDASYDFKVISERLREMAYLNKGLEISLRDERDDSEKTYYFEGGISSFVHSLNRNRIVCHRQPIYLSKAINSTQVEAALQYNDGFAETIFSFANCVNTTDGGTHLTGFRTALTRALNDSARKSKLLKDDDPNLTGEDVREGLTAVVSIKLAEPQFEGQTKAKLGNPEIKGIVESAVVEGLTLHLEEHPDDLRRIIEKCMLAARAREAARKARDLVVKKSSLFSATLPGKLADCSEKEPSMCELYLVEGESAGGSAKMGRNPRFQAILPLRGKILNVEKAASDKMLSHEEIRNLITALGAGIDDELDLARLRYHRVILMTDADVDGSHIRTLLLTFFFRHMVKIINSGYLYIAQPPLYRVSIGKTQEWVYSDEGLARFYAKRAFENVNVYSKDKSINLKGEDLLDYIESLREYSQALNDLIKQTKIPHELGEFLLRKNESLSRLDFTRENRESMLEVEKWLDAGDYKYHKNHDPDKDEYSLDVDVKNGKGKFDRQFFENPLLHRLLIAYPKVKGFVEKESYFIIKNKKEIGNDLPWYKVVELLDKRPDTSGVTLQRYKGLGEMSAEQLWETTMNPSTRTLLVVNVTDAIEADHTFSMLMGDEVPPRKAYIMAHAKSVKNLDV